MDLGESKDVLRRDESAPELASLLGPNDRPNIDALWSIAKDLTPIALNPKFYGDDLAERLGEALPVRAGLLPTPTSLAWKPSTQADLGPDWVARREEPLARA